MAENDNKSKAPTPEELAAENEKLKAQNTGLKTENKKLKESNKEISEKLGDAEASVKAKQKRTTVKSDEHGTYTVLGDSINVGRVMMDGKQVGLKSYTAAELKVDPALVAELHKKGYGQITKKD